MYSNIEQEYHNKNFKRKIELGPKEKFRSFLLSYIEKFSKDGENLTSKEIKQAILVYMEENPSLRNLYKVDDILNWAKDIIVTKDVPRKVPSSNAIFNEGPRNKKRDENDGR